jgi:uncharacterized protein (DUF952 family)
MRIFHVVLPEVWESAARSDSAGSYSAESLRAEGFIHCSFAGQLPGVLERYYAERDKVVILEIESDKLTSKLVCEPSTGGEVYPHIYGAINLDAVVRVEERTLN